MLLTTKFLIHVIQFLCNYNVCFLENLRKSSLFHHINM